LDAELRPFGATEKDLSGDCYERGIKRINMSGHHEVDPGFWTGGLGGADAVPF
jgi:hypothetical protein